MILSRHNVLLPRFGLRLPHLRLCLLESVRHPRLAVHRRRGGEMLLGLLALVRAEVELAKAEVGDEGCIRIHRDATDNSSSNLRACRRSAVSKPSVNQE